jgi:NTE family protein
MVQRCYCVFEGGGAKGIAHVGALAALESPEIRIAGFAGTSAGAIIAALAAVGYSAEDLFGPKGSILDLIDRDRSNIWSGPPNRPVAKPTRLFGWFGWLAIRLARRVSLVPAALAITALLLAGPILSWLNLFGPNGSLAVSLIILLVMILVLWFLAAGLASLHALEWAINQALSLRLARTSKLEQNHRGREPRPITFKQLEDAGCPSLKIVAADITKRELALFSSATTPNESVAAAVAASVCLPIVFRPWRINDSLHLDGGLVSNLPAWTFDPERGVDHDAWTAVVQVGDKPASRRSPRGLSIMLAAIDTGLFGANQLNVRNVDRLRTVRLGVDLQLLQFDLDKTDAADVIDKARKQCVRKLLYQIDSLPKLMTDICRRLAVRAERTINRALQTRAQPSFDGVVRVAMLMPVGEDKLSLLVEYSYGHADHLDERIRLPLASSFAGHALDEEEPLYVERRDEAWAEYLNRPEDRCTRKLIWPDMQWCLCVPHEHRPSGTKFIVGVDSDRYVDLPPDLVDVTMGSISGGVTRMLDRYLPKEAFQDGRA